MEQTPQLNNELAARLPEIEQTVAELTVDAAPPDTLNVRSILESNHTLIETWLARESGKASDGVIDAVVDLVLLTMFKEATDGDARRNLLGVLWARAESAIRYRAKAMVKNIGNRDREADRLEELMQEGFMKFEAKLNKFDPMNSQRAKLTTYLNSVYRNEFINISKSKIMAGLKEDSLLESADSTDEEATAATSKLDDREAVDKALVRISENNERDAEKVEAFKKMLDQGMTNKQVAEAMGRSESWASKSHDRVLGLLQDQFREVNVNHE